VTRARAANEWRGAALAGGLAALVALAACGAGRGGELAARPSGTGSRVVTRELIATWNVLDAYAAVERAGGYRLRDNDRGGVSVTQRRGQTSLVNPNADRPALVVDGAPLTDFSMLHRIRASEIERIELLSPGDATLRYGTLTSGAGAILVTTRRAP
jgi:hypothetical protein